MKIVSQPAVSVVLPVYNGGKYLANAIGSIVDQSFEDWELICVNDGSTDQSSLVLDWFARMDARIQVVHQENRGIVGALNRGCELAQSDLICRMDADDLAMPNRMEHQVDFMQKNSNHVAVGGAILSIDSDSEPLALQVNALDHETIVQRLLRRETGLFHPTTMIRTVAFRKVGGYRLKYQWIEDHDLWLRLSQVGTLANTSELVLCYRQHAASVCWQRLNRQRELMTELIREAHSLRNLLSTGNELTTPPLRSNAGPGKWARMAAKGGYPRIALKHLKALWLESGLTWYSLRMFAEVGIRLLSAPCLNRKIHSTAQVPNEVKWNAIATTCLTREAAN